MLCFPNSGFHSAYILGGHTLSWSPMHASTSLTKKETQVRLHSNLMALRGHLQRGGRGFRIVTTLSCALQILYPLPLLSQYPHRIAPPTSLKPKQPLTPHSPLYDKFKWKINGPFHPQTHKLNTVPWYKAMHAASSSAYFSASFSRSHLPQRFLVPLSNQTFLRTNRAKILPSRITPVRGVRLCGALELVRRLGTPLNNRTQGISA